LLDYLLIINNKTNMESILSHEYGENYDIVFIGGGPSTLSFFIYTTKKGYLNKLLTNFKILIIEKGTSFGSGCLGKYGINSNTSGEGFVRLIRESSEKNDPTALSPTKLKRENTTNIQPIDKEEMPLAFNDINNSDTTKALLSYGNKPAPLSLIGYFLDSMGNSILENIYKVHNRKMVMFNTEVTKVYYNKQFNYEISMLKENTNITIKSKVVVFATGGKQKLDTKLNKELLNIIDQSDFYHSDYVLQEKGYQSLMQKLTVKKRKVVIIGGSHSAFSCAWILLNEPAHYLKVDTAGFYKAKECTKCSTNCFGEVKDRNWRFSNIPLEEIEIEILYKDLIKVYYHSEKDALNDGYNTYDPKKACNKNGNIYPFIGIRGDAKEIYRQIKQGKEKRVKLIKCDSWEKQKKHIENDNIVIWACGYNTNKIAIYEKSTNKNIEFLTDQYGQIEVHKDTLSLLDSNKREMSSLYGIGQGFSTHSVEILTNGLMARADSVSLYSTYIAKKLYKSLGDRTNIIRATVLESGDSKANLLISMNKTIDKPTQISEQNITRDALNSLVKEVNNSFKRANSREIMHTSKLIKKTKDVHQTTLQSINNLIRSKSPNPSIKSRYGVDITKTKQTENIQSTPQKPYLNLRYYDTKPYDRDRNLTNVINKSIEKTKRQGVPRKMSINKSTSIPPIGKTNSKLIPKSDYYSLISQKANYKLNIFSFKK
jgi:lysine/ornithine N-monooxygenase